MATVKSGIGTPSNPGFTSSDTITSTTLNDHVNDATVTDIVTADISDSSSKITGVTFAKMQHISTEKLLGRTTSGEGNVEEVDISGSSGILLDEDDMSTNSNTRGATQQSIKAYIDAEIDKTLGHNQTWQLVTRALDSTEYTNNTGKPIMVNGSFGGSTDNHEVYISIKPSGGSYVEFIFAQSSNSGGGVSSNGSTIVPVDSVYKFRKTGDTINTSEFFELR